MKKAKLILFGGVLAAMLAGCGGKSTSTSGSTPETSIASTVAVTAPPETTVQAPTQAKVPEDDGMISYSNSEGSTLSYLKYELVQDYEKKPSIALYFDYTNNAKESKSAMFDFGITVFQGGVECSDAILTEVSAEYENTLKEIKSGITLPVCFYYVLNDASSDIEIEVGDLIDFSGKVDTQMIKLAGESGIPAQGNESGAEESTVEAQASAVGAINFEDKDGSKLIYTKHEIVKDYQGNSALAVYFDFTNNADKAQATMYAYSIKAFQNGVECVNAMLTSPSAEYQNTLKEVKKGSSIPICWYFTLTDDSNVEVEVSSLFDFSGDNKSMQTITIK